MDAPAQRLAGLAPAELDLLVERLRTRRSPKAPGRIPRLDRQREAFPLSSAQERLWFLGQLDGGQATYNIAAALHLSGELDVTALARSLGEILSRHEILRARLGAEDGVPFQTLAAAAPPGLSEVDLRGLSPTAAQALSQALARAEACRPFQLAGGPLIRTCLLTLGPTAHLLVLVMHHAVADGWSCGLLVREVAELYAGWAGGRPASLPELPIQYVDYAVWQRGLLDGGALADQMSYWEQRLAGGVRLLDLPADHPRPAVRSARGGRIPMRWPAELTAAVHQLAARQRVTPFAVLLAVWTTLLARYAGQADIAVACPFAGRNRSELEPLIGCFVNTLILRVDTGGEPAFEELVSRCAEVVAAATVHQDLPFERLVQRLLPERSLSHAPLAQVAFSMESAPLGFELPLLRLQLHELDTETAKFDLLLNLGELEHRLGGFLEYSRDLFDPPTALRMCGHLQQLCAAAVARPGQRSSRLGMLTAAESWQMLGEWNDTSAASRGRRIDQLFAEQAAATPAAVALIAGEEALTYRELDCRSNRLAHFLRGVGVEPQALVAVRLPRSAELVVALLAVLKAGAAYLPIDPAYPAERSRFLLADSGARFLVTAADLPAEPAAGQVVAVDSMAREILACSDSAPEAELPAGALAYLIYTSGSTGQPKGVAISHGAAAELVQWGSLAFAPRELAGVLAATSVCFDLSVFEIFVPLCTGGRVVLAAQALELADLAACGEVTLLNTVPSAAAELARQGAIPPSVITINLAGEALSAELAERLYRLPNVERVLNSYGPSEDTTYSTWATVERSSPRAPAIGRPLPNTRVYLVEPGGLPAPLGVAGELLIAGAGLAWGYLHRPGLTAERFVPDALGARPGGRLYRTGDLARYRADGQLEFLGRIDQQVKVRGFRIEPGEIEAALCRHPAVGEAAVVAVEVAGEPTLVGYVAAAGTEGVPPAGDLAHWLRASLPAFMVPSIFVPLAVLPRTANGKLDRAVLPAPVPAAGARRFVAPRTATEELLTEIWSEVLGVEPIGVEDNFFEFGGHSLLAARLVSRIRDAFGRDLPLRELFEAPTVSALAVRVEARGPLPAAPSIEARTDGGPLPLSFEQERLWLASWSGAASAVYNMAAAVRLEGALDAAALAWSCGELVRRHAVLRARFGDDSGRPVQTFAAPASVELPVIDLSGLGPEACQAAARQAAVQQARAPFDLVTGPPLRLGLLRLAPQHHLLVWVLHHLVADGWSMGLLVRDVVAFYRAGMADGPRPAELAIQYGDYVRWQRETLTGDLLAALLASWQLRLAGAPEVLSLPTDRPRPPVQGVRGGHLRLALPARLMAALQQQGRRQGATLFMTLLGAFGALLARYAGEPDLVVGSPMANRVHRAFEDLIGLFANTLPLRLQAAGELSWAMYLRAVREVSLEAYSYQSVPLAALLAEAGPQRLPGRSPLFQVVFALQQELALPQVDGLVTGVEELSTGTAKFDLSLLLTPGAGGLHGLLEYATDLFDPASVLRLGAHFERLLEAVAAAPETPLAALPLLSPAEDHQLRIEWCDTAVACPDACVHELFAAVAAAGPTAPAVVCGGRALSYGELDRLSNRLARRLRRLGAGPEVPVAICAERSFEMIVGLLAILKSGAAYVAVDPAHPAARRAFNVAEAGCPLLLVQESLRDLLPEAAGGGPLVVPFDAELTGLAGEESDERLPRAAAADNLAYILYTSGSTGNPKGVAVTHRSVVRLVRGNGFAGLGPQEVLLQLAPLAFDASVFEIWGALVNGGRLEVFPPHPPALGELGRFLAAQGVTCAWLTAGLFHQMVEEEIASLTSLRQLLVGGDVVSVPHVEALLRAAPGLRLIDGYGPTEGTTFTCCYRVPPEEPAGASLPIGRAIANTAVHVVDRHFGSSPAGVPGELWIGGEGLARGYFHRPDLTADRFVPDPFGSAPGTRLYRSGDLVRWRGDGALEFLGRIDQQVKIRGFRIEPGEIEAALCRHPAVCAAVVVARGAGAGRRLVAYVVGRDGDPSTSELLRDLREHLPEAMIPSAVVPLARLPLTPNGKVDRRALPVPGTGERQMSRAPRTPTEELLTGIWAEVLDLGAVGVDDDFFALGGHSLLATRAVSRIREVFGRELALQRLFELPTVAGLARELDEAARESSRPPLRRKSGGRPVRLSFAQERLWFLDRLDPQNPAYNIPAAARLGGPLDPALLARCLNRLVDRHESLRMVFTTVDGLPVQHIVPALSVPLPLVDLSGLASAGRREQQDRCAEAEASTPFVLERLPLLRACLLRLGSEEHVLLITVHHIVCDGWSMRLLVDELARLYGAAAAGAADPLPPLPVQYAEYAQWQRDWLSGAEGEAQLAYWIAALGPEVPAFELPADFPRPPVQTFRAGRRTASLPPELADRLRSLASRHRATLFMVLLAALQLHLQRLSGEDDIVVGSPIAGRTASEVENLVGLFLNSLALRLDLSGNPTFAELLLRARAVAMAAYAHQEVPVERVIEALAPRRDTARNALFQVFFNLLNLPRREVPATGLRVAEIDTPDVGAKLDLTLYVRDLEGGLRCDLVYNADLFDPPRMEELLAQFATLLAQAVEETAVPIGDWSLLTASARAVLPDPRQDLGNRWYGAVHEVFSRQAARLPEQIAITDGRDQVTYRALDRASSRLARRLHQSGLKPEGVVAVYGHLSAPLVLAVLGILKAGGAFLILDPAYPAARLVTSLGIARPAAWIAVAAAGAPPPELERSLDALVSGARLELSRDDLEAGSEDEGAGFHAEVGPGHLACIAFTSGSTGVPKGILGRHGPLSHFIPWQQQELGLDAADRFCMLSALSHDPLQRDMFTPLQIGGTIVIPDLTAASGPGRLARWLGEERVTVAHLTPAMLRLISEGAEAGAAASLRLALLVGEALTWSDVARLQVVAPRVQCVNLYGSTETQRAVGYHRVRMEHVASGERARGRSLEVLPLGRGMAGVQLLVVNRWQGQAGIGELGEIFVRSHHLARGYLDDPVLTTARFLSNPWVPGAGGDRLYRTGDLGRYLPDGQVAFAGRVDQQVKVRGFRVEPGEIEAFLKSHEAVRDAAVMLREDGGEPYLAAYLVAAVAPPPEAAELRVWMRSRLPDYMVPAAVVWLAAIPLTPNRKVDRRALPVPPRHAGPPDTPAESPTEELVAQALAQVLGVDRVGREESFFELGGHSLLAAQATSRLRATFGIELPLRALFETPTVAELARRVVALRGAAAPASAPPLTPLPPEPEVALSFAQERLWFLHQIEPLSPAFNLPFVIRITGALRPAALAASLDEIVRRHEPLRTLFPAVAGRPVQRIAPPAPLALPLLDLSALPQALAGPEGLRLAAEQVRRSFNLEAEPPIRWCALRLADESHLLAIAVHHLAADGWSMRILAAELAALYTGQVSSRPPALAELRISYGDFSRWQRSWLQGEALEALLDYWRLQLAGAPGTLELPVDRPRGAVRGSRGRRWTTELPAALLRRLHELGRRRGVTLFMTLLAAFDALLSRYSGEVDLVVGTPIAQRNQVEIEGLIGLFANTLVLRADLSGAPGFAELLAQLRETTLAAYDHQDLPFAKLVEDLRPERAMSRTPLFQTMLVLQNTPQPPATVAGLEFQTVEVETGGAQLDLSLYVAETRSGSLAQTWELSADLFDTTTVMRLSQHLQALLEAALVAPEQPCSSLPLLAEAETAQLRREWNDTAADFPRQGTLHEIFAAQAQRTPQAPAVQGLGGLLTYGDLDRRANRLAHHLLRLGVGPEQRVAVFLERTCDLVVALLAVLKAGAAYVPLDPAYPHERLALILEDTGWPLVITQQSVAERLDPQRQVVLDRDRAAIDSCPSGDPRVPLSSLALSYVIYTSGSTGRPKGVAITHRSAVSLVAWAGRSFPAADLARVVAATSICFDLSVFELFAPLCHGGSVLLAANILELPSLPASWRPTLLNTVPAAMAELVRLAAVPASVRTVILAGEVLPWDLAQRIFELGTVERLLNLYGPSEDTTYSTGVVVDRSSLLPPSIGRPLDNTLAYLLDRRLEPVPIGAVAELWLGGENLARGYLNRPDLTAERFLPDLFCGESGGRMYRTGDLARYRPDGTLEFLGRVDQQVKLRGFRIEPGEIEAALAAHPGVFAAAVVVREVAGDRRLVAYVEPVDVAAGPNAAALRFALRERLPEFMVPSTFVVVERLPRTPSQKIDRNALPSPPLAEAGGPAAPATELERLIADVFGAALGMPAVGRTEDFFELGGHSLLAIQVVARLRATLDAEIDLRALFAHPTAAGLAVAVESGQGAAAAARPRAITTAPRLGSVPASLSQERLWFVDRLEPGNAVYNLAVALRIEGPLQVGRLRRALAELYLRHEALRTTFAEIDGTAVQQAAEASEVPFALVDLDALPRERRDAVARELGGGEIARPFDLTAGPLVRLCLLRTEARAHVAVLTTHHIVADGWSLGVLVEDLTTLYAGTASGPEPLPELPVQYADFAVWQRQWLQGEVLADQIAYWTRKLAGAPTLTPLPTDYPRPLQQRFRGTRLSWECPPQLALRVRELSRRLSVTPFMTLMAAFQALLHAHNGQEDILVGTPVSYRNWPEIQRVCGFFVNTLVMRADLAGDPDFATLASRVRSTLLEALANQDLPLNRLIAELKLERRLSHSPLFQVGFTYGVEPPAVKALPDLEISPVELDLETTQFDLNLAVAEPTREGFVGALHYNRDLFKPATAAALLEDYERILERVSLDSSVRLTDLRQGVARAVERRRTGIGRTLGEASRTSFKSRVARRTGGVAPTPPNPSPDSDRE